MSPLNISIRYLEDLSIAKFLIDSEADTNIADPVTEYTPLIAAILENRPPKFIRYLLHNEARIDQPDANGWTPLMHAVDQKNVEIIQLLLDSEASFILKNDKNQTIFDLAKSIDNEEVTTILKQLEKK